MTSWLSLTDAKGYLRKKSEASDDDARLQRLIDAACELIEEKKGYVQQTPIDETLNALRGGTVILNERPLLAVSSVTILRPSGSVSVPQFDPTVGGVGWSLAAAGVLNTPAECGEYVQVIYTAGYASVPENFIEAALALTLNNWRASQTNPGGKRPGSNVDQLVMPGTNAALPYRVRELLGLDGKHVTDEVLIA